MLTCTGAAILFGWKEFFAPATIVAAFGGHWGNLIARCIMRLDRLADGDCHSPHDAVL